MRPRAPCAVDGACALRHVSSGGPQAVRHCGAGWEGHGCHRQGAGRSRSTAPSTVAWMDHSRLQRDDAPTERIGVHWHACRQSAVVGEYHPVRHGDAHVRDAVAVESVEVVVRDEVRVVVRHALQADSTTGQPTRWQACMQRRVARLLSRRATTHMLRVASPGRMWPDQMLLTANLGWICLMRSGSKNVAETRPLPALPLLARSTCSRC